jgi:hypothetical protein
MIKCKELEVLADFEGLKKGDSVAVEWRRNVNLDKRGKKQTRFAFYEVAKNQDRTTEIILNLPLNVYFNYLMFLEPKLHGVSNVRSITLLTAEHND